MKLVDYSKIVDRLEVVHPIELINAFFDILKDVIQQHVLPLHELPIVREIF